VATRTVEAGCALHQNLIDPQCQLGCLSLLCGFSTVAPGVFPPRLMITRLGLRFLREMEAPIVVNQTDILMKTINNSFCGTLAGKKSQRIEL